MASIRASSLPSPAARKEACTADRARPAVRTNTGPPDRTTAGAWPAPPVAEACTAVTGERTGAELRVGSAPTAVDSRSGGSMSFVVTPLTARSSGTSRMAIAPISRSPSPRRPANARTVSTVGARLIRGPIRSRARENDRGTPPSAKGWKACGPRPASSATELGSALLSRLSERTAPAGVRTSPRLAPGTSSFCSAVATVAAANR
jgi:hypothetical protein